MAADRRLRLVYAGLAVLLLALLAALVVAAESPAFRYAAMPCQEHLTYAAEGPVDAVVVGSSRSQYGVDARLLAEGLGLDPDRTAVVNLARGGRGPGQLHQQLVDLEEARGIDGPILFEVGLDDAVFWRRTPLYYQYYPGYPAAARTDALVADWRTKPREPRYSRARDLTADLLTRLDMALQTLFTGTWRAPDEAAPVGAADCRTRTDDTTRPGERRQLIRREKAIRRALGDAPDAWLEQAPHPVQIDRVNQDRQVAYLRETVAFARAHDLPLVLYALPSYLDPPVSEAALRAFEERVGVPVAVPPLDVLERLTGRETWRDAHHVNDAGSRILTAWLAEEARGAAVPR